MLNSTKAFLNVQQMGEADRLTIAGGTPGIVLIEDAGASVARAVLAHWSVRPVAVLCGPGNNGGDGFVVAGASRRTGGAARAALLGQREHLQGGARHHANLWKGTIEPLAPQYCKGRGSSSTRCSEAALAGRLRVRRQKHWRQPRDWNCRSYRSMRQAA